MGAAKVRRLAGEKMGATSPRAAMVRAGGRQEFLAAPKNLA
jgi:hypothetical protein